MKKLILIVTLLITSASFAQVITSDKKDDFTDTHIFNIEARKNKDLSLEDNISDDKKGDKVFLGLAIEKKIDSTPQIAIMISMISNKPRCFYKQELFLLFEDGQKSILKQITKSVCDTALVVGYSVSNEELDSFKNKILKKIRVTDNNSFTDYTIDNHMQTIVKKTLQMTADKLNEIQQ